MNEAKLGAPIIPKAATKVIPTGPKVLPKPTKTPYTATGPICAAEINRPVTSLCVKYIFPEEI